MGLVIFAPTPSFACEKMRLLQTRAHTHGARTQSWTNMGYSIYTIYRLCHAFIFSYSVLHIYTSIIFPFPSSALEFVIAASLACCECARPRAFCRIRK